MNIRIEDFFGEIEWVRAGESLTVDSDYRCIEDLVSISTEDIEGPAILAHGQPIDPRRQVPQLRDLLADLSYKYEQIYISDTNGDYFNADGQTNNIMDRNYFHEVMEGHTVVSEPLINKSTKNPIIAVATPIWNKRAVIGLFGVTILLNSSWRGLRFMSLTRFPQKAKVPKKKRRSGNNRRIGLKDCLTARKAVQGTT